MYNFKDWSIKSINSPYSLNVGLLAIRLLYGLTLSFRHGWPTLINWWNGDIAYPDPIGLGESLTMLLMGTAEAILSLFIAIGLFTRLSAFGLTIGFLLAFFVVHSADPFAVKELPFLYLIGVFSILLIGPGKISMDYHLWRDR